MKRPEVLLIHGGRQRMQAFEAVEKYEVRHCEDEIAALKTVGEIRPQIVLLHYALRREQTLAFVEWIMHESPASKVVIIAETLHDDAILDLLMVGASGYMAESETEKFGAKMFDALQRGEAWISRRMVAKLLHRLRREIVV